MIDPAIWEDEEFGKLSMAGKVLFIGLFSNADDEGRIRANTAYIKSTIFMYDTTDIQTIELLLVEVTKTMKSVRLYEVDGKQYIQLLNWNEYQKQHKDRIQSSTLPIYNEDVSDNVGQVTDNDGVSKVKLSKVKLSSIVSDEPKPLSNPVPGEKKEPGVRLPPEKQNIIHRLVYHLEDTLNTRITNWGKQGEAVKLMTTAGYTEEQIKKTITHMATKDEFYRDKGFDLMTVSNQIPLLKAKAEAGRRNHDQGQNKTN